MVIDSRYEIIKKLGEGGMAEVYLAHDMHTGIDVALKITTPGSDTLRDRFEREIDVLSNINHPNIVTLISSGSLGESLWYTMEYIEGSYLTDWFFSKLDSDYSVLASTIAEVAGALARIHEMGIIHRDIKPENILVRDDVPIVVDFGAAYVSKHDHRTRLTKAGSMVGTVLYMSPEQVTGSNLDGRSDLYSLGVIIYQMLTGRVPSDADEIPRLILKILQERPLRPTAVDPGIPKDFEKIVLKLLEKNPDLRFETGLQLQEALLQFAEGAGVEDSGYHSPMRAAPRMEIPLVGREQELNKLSLLLHSARASQGQVALITGKKGLGKSRLIEEFRMIALAELSKFFICRGLPEGSVRPSISLVLDQFANYELSCDPTIFTDHPHMIRSLSPALADVYGVPEEPPNIQDAPEIPAVISELLVSAFPDIPSIFAFEEDTDELTKSVALELAQKTTGKKVIVCMAAADGSTLETWTKLPNYSEIKLSSFTDSQIRTLATEILSRNLTEPEFERVNTGADGNPHQVVQILSAIKNESKTIDAATIPVDLDLIYKDRIKGLNQNAINLLQLLVLMRGSIPVSLLSSLAIPSDTIFQDGFEELEKHNLIAEKNTGREIEVQLASDKIKDIALSLLGGDAGLKEIHLMIAQSFEVYYHGTDDPDILEDIGNHYLLAGDYTRAADKTLKSLKIARRMGLPLKETEKLKPFEANTHKITDSKVLRILFEILLYSYSAQTDLGGAEKVLAQAEKEIEEGRLNKEEQAWIYMSAAEIYNGFGQTPKSATYVEKVDEIYSYTTDDFKPIFHMTKIHTLINQGKIAEVNEQIEIIEKIAETTEIKVHDQISLHQIKAIYYSQIGDKEGSINEFLKALKITRDIHHKFAELAVLSNLGYSYQLSERYEESIKYMNLALLMAENINLTQHQEVILQNLVRVHIKRGDVREYKKSLDRLRDVCEKTPFSTANIQWLEYVVELKCLKSQYDEASELISETKLKVIESNQPIWLRMVYSIEAFLALHSGDYRRLMLLSEQVKDLLSYLKDEDVKFPLFDLNYGLIVSSVELNGDSLKAGRLYKENAKLVTETGEKDSPKYLDLKYLEAFTHFSKSTKRTFTGKTVIDLNAWSLSYVALLEIFELIKERNIVISVLPTDSVRLLAKLVVRRLMHDKKLNAAEKKQIYETSTKEIAWLLARYREFGFTHRKDEIIGLNNELISLM